MFSFKKLTMVVACVLTLASFNLGAQPLKITRDDAPTATQSSTLRRTMVTPRTVSAFPTHAKHFTAPSMAPGMLKVAGAAAADAPTLYGSMIYSDTWNINDTNYGMYSFTAANPIDFSVVKLSNALNANAGGVYADGKFYFINFFDVSGSIFAYFNAYDATTWERLAYNRVEMTSIATDLTYDPIGEKIYGCFLNSTGDGYVFGRMSQADGSVYGIANLDGPLFAIAADANGEIYGITLDGYLSKIDKSNGKLTRVGSTGLIPSNSQSATFDYKTNTLYWAACTSTAWGLYTVSTSTGKATLVAPFDNREEFGGLYVTSQTAPAKAPGELTDFSFDYISTTTANIKVKFTMPTKTFDGSSLSGSLDYVVSINDVDIDLGQANAGQKVELTLQNNTAGMATVSVYAMNDAGKGPAARDRKWIGVDVPENVTNLIATTGTNKITVTWDAPTKGVHNGYFDPSTLTYRVVRQPGSTVLASHQKETSYVDNIASDDLSSYYYEVTVYAGNTMGGTESTNKVLIGNALTLPYIERFDSELDFNNFTVIDVNADGKTWCWDNSGTAKSVYSMSQNMNDWLITPPIKLSASDLNELCFKVRTVNYLERFEVYVGKANTVEGMTQQLMEPVEIRNTTFETYKLPLLVETDGVYFIGFHHISDKGKYNLYIDDIELSVSSAIGAPGAVTDLKAVADPQGACSATVSFKAPTTSLNGGKLTELTKINIYRGSKIIKSIANPTQGAEYSYTDDAPDFEMNEYRVIAMNSIGTGLESSVKVFVGPDVPGLPTNIRLRDENGKAILTWEPPVGGVNGGYIDKDNLLYHICVFDQGTLRYYKKNLTVCRFEDEPQIDEQQEVAYVVFAESSKGIGQGDISNVIVMGTPFDLPFNESFANAMVTYSAWGFANDDENDDSQWGLETFGTLPTCQPVDGDNGLLSFYPSYEHAKSFIHSGKISMKNTENPVAEFYYYYKRKATDVIELQVTSDGIEYKTIETIKMNELDTNTGWKKVSVPLTAYKGKDFIQIAFRVEAGDDITSLHFDNISVRDVKNNDLAATRLDVPAKFCVGREATFTVTVANVGLQAASAFEVGLFRDGQQVATINGRDLQPDEEKTYEIKQTPHQNFGEAPVYYAQVFYGKDQEPANDKTIAKAVTVTHPNYPVVNDLNGTIDESTGTTTLNWTAPDMNFEKTIVDSFEDYETFAISGVGDWGLIDNDKDQTFYINGKTWSHIGDAQAFIVFNHEKAGVDEDYAARTGKQHMVAFASELVANDDWLISPRLNGKAQTVKFWVRSITNYYGTETFEVYFTNYEFRDNIMNYIQDYTVGGAVGEEWTEVTVDLPEGTTYFAIRHTSTNCYGFCVDDVEFTPQTDCELTFKGFDVYCNKTKLNDAPIQATEFKHAGVDPKGGYHYHVVCVFEQGESPASNIVMLGETSLEANVADAVVVETSRNLISLYGATGKDFAIYTVDGRLAFRGVAAESTSVEVAGGVYIVNVAGKSYKVVVK